MTLRFEAESSPPLPRDGGYSCGSGLCTAPVRFDRFDLIIERNHRTVKVIAARKQCSILEAVHLYNITPRDGEVAGTAPASGVYTYPVRDRVRPESVHASKEPSESPPPENGLFSVGDSVWVRKPGSRCTERSRCGEVTAIVSRQTVEVDGVPWHVRDVRLRHENGGHGDPFASNDEPPMYCSVCSLTFA